MVKGLKNAYLMHFPSLHSWFRCRVCFYLKCSSSHNKRVIQRVKKHFFCQNLFQLMYDHKPKSNVHLRKNTKHLTVRGGSTLMVSLTVKYPFFLLTTSLTEKTTDNVHNKHISFYTQCHFKNIVHCVDYDDDMGWEQRGCLVFT